MTGRASIQEVRTQAADVQVCKEPAEILQRHPVQIKDIYVASTHPGAYQMNSWESLCLVGHDEHTRTPHCSACGGTSPDPQGSQCSTKVNFEDHLIKTKGKKEQS